MSVGTDSDDKRYVKIESDIKNVEFVLRILGLEGSNAKLLKHQGSRSMKRNLH